MKLKNLKGIEFEIVEKLNNGQKIQLEYNPKTQEIKLLQIISKKIIVKNGC